MFFFHSLSGFRGFPGVISLSIASVDANNISNVLGFAFRGPVPEASFFFFFSQPVAGLTNRVPVRDSRARAPWVMPLTCRACHCTNDANTFWSTGQSLFLPPSRRFNGPVTTAIHIQMDIKNLYAASRFFESWSTILLGKKPFP